MVFKCAHCLRRCRVGQVAVTADEENYPGPEKKDIFKPEELDLELIEEVGVEEEDDTLEEVADERDEDEELPAGPVAPGADEEGYDDDRNLRMMMMTMMMMMMMMWLMMKMMMMMMMMMMTMMMTPSTHDWTR